MFSEIVALRCTAPHPANPFRTCRAWLVNVVGGSVDVAAGAVVPPGGVEVRCPRCGTRYAICPARKSA